LAAKRQSRLNEETSPDRVPPQDLEAEQATLGAMLVEAGATARAFGLLREEDFYREAHRLIFRAMLDVYTRNEPVDIVTVAAELQRQGKLDAVGGGEYLTALIAEVPTAAHVQSYATIVAEKSVLRQMISAGSLIQALAYENPANIGDALDKAEQAIFEITQRRVSSDFTPIAPVVFETFEKLDRKCNDPGFFTGVPTGLRDFDELTSGLQPGDLIIVAGRPSMGKTSLAVANFALHAGVNQKIGVGIFSLEMSKSQLAEMLLCAHARVNSHSLRRGFAKEDDWAKIGYALKDLPNAPIFIDDTPAIPVLELRSKARRLKAQHDIGLIIVDYLQLASTGDRRDESRYEEVSTVARALKALARELEVPVVALSQLSRLVERREDKRPVLSDLAESGAIEAEADLVCFLYRPDYYKKKEELEKATKQGQKPDRSSLDEPGEAEIIVAKHRNGPIGTVRCVFNPRYRVFDNLAYDREDESPV
jgi:replicative DNA helicase